MSISCSSKKWTKEGRPAILHPVFVSFVLCFSVSPSKNTFRGFIQVKNNKNVLSQLIQESELTGQSLVIVIDYIDHN